MSSSIYPHRGLPPAAAPGAQGRLDSAFDTIRAEFEALTAEVITLRKQREDLDNSFNHQLTELTLLRQSMYELENKHAKIRQQYEDELARLRAELTQAARQGPPGPPTGPGLGPGAGIPPSYGPGGDGFYSRSSREEPRRVGREDRERERERERAPIDRERGMDRERERPAERERDIDRKLKSDRMKSDRGDPYSPSLSAGPSNGRAPPPPTGPGLPPPATPTNGDYPMSDGTNPGTMTAYRSSMGCEDFTEDFDPYQAGPDRKKEGPDWWAVFSAKAKRTLDVSLVHTLQHDTFVCCVRFSADGKYLATGCNRVAQIFDVKTGQKTCVLVDENTSSTGDLYIRSVCFSPDGKYLATGAEDTRIRVWDIKQKRIARTFDGHSQDIYSLQFSRDGRLIVSGSGDRTARVWDTMGEGSAPGPLTRVLSIEEPDVDAGVTSVAISPDGRLVAAGSLDTAVRIWDVQTGALIEKLRGHRDSVYSVAFTPDSKGLVSSSLDKTLKYWDVRTLMRRDAAGMPPRAKEGDKLATCTQTFIAHKDYVLSVAISTDGQWIVSGSKDRGVCFWDARSATPQLMIQGHKNSVMSIDLNPVSGILGGGGVLASGSGDCLARIWSYGPSSEARHS